MTSRASSTISIEFSLDPHLGLGQAVDAGVAIDRSLEELSLVLHPRPGPDHGSLVHARIPEPDYVGPGHLPSLSVEGVEDPVDFLQHENMSKL